MSVDRSERRVYREIFFMYHGAGPWPCYFCGEAITLEELYTVGRKQDPTIHHIDEDQSNNDPVNLAMAHGACHVSYHNTGRHCPPHCKCKRHKRVISPEESKRRSEGLKRAYREGRR